MYTYAASDDFLKNKIKSHLMLIISYLNKTLDECQVMCSNIFLIIMAGNHVRASFRFFIISKVPASSWKVWILVTTIIYHSIITHKLKLINYITSCNSYLRVVLQNLHRHAQMIRYLILINNIFLFEYRE